MNTPAILPYPPPYYYPPPAINAPESAYKANGKAQENVPQAAPPRNFGPAYRRAYMGNSSAYPPEGFGSAYQNAHSNVGPAYSNASTHPSPAFPPDGYGSAYRNVPHNAPSSTSTNYRTGTIQTGPPGRYDSAYYSHRSNLVPGASTNVPLSYTIPARRAPANPTIPARAPVEGWGSTSYQPTPTGFSGRHENFPARGPQTGSSFRGASTMVSPAFPPGGFGPEYQSSYSPAVPRSDFGNASQTSSAYGNGSPAFPPGGFGPAYERAFKPVSDVGGPAYSSNAYPGAHANPLTSASEVGPTSNLRSANNAFSEAQQTGSARHGEVPVSARHHRSNAGVASRVAAAATGTVSETNVPSGSQPPVWQVCLSFTCVT